MTVKLGAHPRAYPSICPRKRPNNSPRYRPKKSLAARRVETHYRDRYVVGRVEAALTKRIGALSHIIVCYPRPSGQRSHPGSTRSTARPTSKLGSVVANLLGREVCASWSIGKITRQLPDTPSSRTNRQRIAAGVPPVRPPRLWSPSTPTTGKLCSSTGRKVRRPRPGR
jgi:hypothetical protein